MLTRFVRTQLVLFTIAAIIGVAIMLFTYMKLPTLLGLGRVTVNLQLPASGGLYQFSNVTYRGSQIGKVTGVKLTENGAEATLSLDRSRRCRRTSRPRFAACPRWASSTSSFCRTRQRGRTWRTVR